MTIQPFASLTGLDRLWQATQGDPHVVIALLDGPVDTAHACFQGARVQNCGGGLVARSAASNGLAMAHGTHVASTIVGQPGSPVVGVAPGCTVRVCPVFVDQGAGLRACTQPDLARALWSALRPSRGVAPPLVINISGGELMPRCAGTHCPTAVGFAHPSLRAAIEECHRRGVLVVAAAGNDGCRCQHVPAALPGVLAVGALEAQGPAPYSNHGPVYARQGVLAPGRAILGAVPGGGTIARDGTSFACGVVSGLAALLLSLQQMRGQEPSARAVREALLRSRDAIRSSATPSNHPGALNALRAAQLLFPSKGALTMNELQERAAVEPRPKSQVAPSSVSASCACQSNPASDVEEEELLSSVDASDFAEGLAVPAASVGREKPARGRRVRPSLAPSACGCQQQGQPVYVVGELSYDFGLLVRQRSLQDNFDGAVLNGLNVADPAHFLMYLLGYDGVGADGGPRRYGGHLYDASSVIWLLSQDGCPKYAVRPTGPFAEAAYLELVRFLFESQGIRPNSPVQGRPNLVIPVTALDRFFADHGGLETAASSLDAPSDAPLAAVAAEVRAQAEATVASIARVFGETLDRASHLAFAGRLGGTVQLLSGETVPVIEPQMRGTASWNTARLLLALAPDALNDVASRALATRLVSRLYHEMRNDGLAPQDRAKNFGATAAISLLGSVLADPLGLFASLVAGGDGKPNAYRSLAVDGIEVNPAPCNRLDSDPYDVDVAFFDFDNQFRGRTVLSLTVDVADVVPRLDGYRIYTRS
ncbi:MAG: S8 family serine peptidase [Pirellulales bacterium]